MFNNKRYIAVKVTVTKPGRTADPDYGAGRFAFQTNKAPSAKQLTEVLHTISQRVANFLERRGLLQPDGDNSYLTLDELGEDPMQARFTLVQ